MALIGHNYAHYININKVWICSASLYHLFCSLKIHISSDIVGEHLFVFFPSPTPPPPKRAFALAELAAKKLMTHQYAIILIPKKMSAPRRSRKPRQVILGCGILIGGVQKAKVVFDKSTRKKTFHHSKAYIIQMLVPVSTASVKPQATYERVLIMRVHRIPWNLMSCMASRVLFVGRFSSGTVSEA